MQQWCAQGVQCIARRAQAAQLLRNCNAKSCIESRARFAVRTHRLAVSGRADACGLHPMITFVMGAETMMMGYPSECCQQMKFNFVRPIFFE